VNPFADRIAPRVTVRGKSPRVDCVARATTNALVRRSHPLGRPLCERPGRTSGTGLLRSTRRTASSRARPNERRRELQRAVLRQLGFRVLVNVKRTAPRRGKGGRRSGSQPAGAFGSSCESHVRLIEPTQHRATGWFGLEGLVGGSARAVHAAGDPREDGNDCSGDDAWPASKRSLHLAPSSPSVRIRRSTAHPWQARRVGPSGSIKSLLRLNATFASGPVLRESFPILAVWTSHGSKHCTPSCAARARIRLDRTF
jgi:hypothetical protein